MHRSLLRIAIALSTAMAAPVFGQSVVVPNGNATVTGNDTSGPLPGSSVSARSQTVFDPDQFPSGPIDITGFTWRAAPGTGAVNVSLSGNIYLSTSPNWANSTGHPLISTTFANNVGSDNTLVMSPSNFTLTGAGCAAPGPCPFANNIVFTTPFRYNRANGPLLIDIQATSFSGSGTGEFDVIQCANSSCVINGVFAVPVDAATGELGPGGNVTQLTYTPASTTATLFVPVILSSSGAAGSFYTSEMALTNRGTTPASITYTYVAATGGGTGSASDSLAPGEQRIVSDAINYLRVKGVPLPDSGNRVGTLRVAFAGLSSASAAVVTVRTATPVPPGAPAGRAGLAYSGVPVGQLLAGTAYLCALRESASDRTNVAIQNGGAAADGDVRLRVTFLSGDGSSVTGSVEQTLSPGDFHQYRLTDIAPAAANGYVRVERVSGSAPYYAYAVINDNVTSDGSFITPLP